MKKIIVQILAVVFLLLFFVIIFIYGCLSVVYRSDNVKTKDILTLSLLETSAAYFLPSIFLNEQEISQIIQSNTVKLTTEQTDTSLVEISKELTETEKEIELIEVSGATYKGRMLVIPDPSRVYLATPTWGFEHSNGGMTVEDMVARDDAIAGTNAGGFKDVKGTGNGSTPTGYVIQDGEITYGSAKTVDCVTGFDENNTLIVGRMSGKSALEAGIVNGFCFSLSDVGPLIINGTPVDISGSGSGLNPRTAIGQKADGTIILLSIDGRQAHSLGAVYNDLIEIFLEHDVINASNLDGGSSSTMIYQGETVSVSSSLYGDRRLPTAILVK